MPIFDYTFTVDAPLEAVAEFHQDMRAFRRLTPPPVIVRFSQTGPMAEGAVSAFTLWFGPIPAHWVARHFNVDPPHGFSDRQESGPMARWEHTHRFDAIDHTRTRVREHIEYEHRPGLKGLLTRLAFGKPMLYLLFTYRKWITRLSLRGAQAGGT